MRFCLSVTTYNQLSLHQLQGGTRDYDIVVTGTCSHNNLPFDHSIRLLELCQIERMIWRAQHELAVGSNWLPSRQRAVGDQRWMQQQGNTAFQPLFLDGISKPVFSISVGARRATFCVADMWGDHESSTARPCCETPSAPSTTSHRCKLKSGEA